MTKPRASLRSDNCPTSIGTSVRFELEQVSDFVGMRRMPNQARERSRTAAQTRRYPRALGHRDLSLRAPSQTEQEKDPGPLRLGGLDAKRPARKKTWASSPFPPSLSGAPSFVSPLLMRSVAL